MSFVLGGGLVETWKGNLGRFVIECAKDTNKLLLQVRHPCDGHRTQSVST